MFENMSEFWTKLKSNLFVIWLKIQNSIECNKSVKLPTIWVKHWNTQKANKWQIWRTTQHNTQHINPFIRHSNTFTSKTLITFSILIQKLCIHSTQLKSVLMFNLDNWPWLMLIYLCHHLYCKVPEYILQGQLSSHDLAIDLTLIIQLEFNKINIALIIQQTLQFQLKVKKRE